MDRISGANNVLNVAGKRTFADRNASTGVPGTFFNAEWCNGVQESLVLAAEFAGLDPTDADNTQLCQAIGLLTAGVVMIQIGSGSGTWVVPNYVYSINLLALGAGGPGGIGNAGAGAGGCGGGLVYRRIAVSPGQQINWFCGGGGSAGVSGQSSAIGGISAGGGAPGGNGVPGALSSLAVGGAFANGGQISIGGGIGQLGNAYGSIWLSGYGCGSFLGNGAVGVSGGTTAASPGVTCFVPGAGGSGGTGGNTGGTGGPGLVAMWK